MIVIIPRSFVPSFVLVEDVRETGEAKGADQDQLAASDKRREGGGEVAGA